MHQCRDFKIISSKKGKLTDAERANGIEEQWGFYISFIFFNESSDKWLDRDLNIEIKKRNGKWVGQKF